VGKIAQRRTIIIAVSGNFAHPTSSEYLAAISWPAADASSRTILIPPAINNHQSNQAGPPHAADSTSRDPN
jgi:hypothetical protein